MDKVRRHKPKQNRLILCVCTNITENENGFRIPFSKGQTLEYLKSDLR